MRIVFLILKFLYRSDAKNEVVSLSAKEIAEVLDKEDYAYKERTIFNNLKKMLSEGYVKEGLKDGKSRTFYITKAGIEWMRAKERDVDEDEEE